jgi:hypothetical protein
VPWPKGLLTPRQRTSVFGPDATNWTLPSPTAIAEAELPPENPMLAAPLKATLQVPDKTSPSGIVMVTGPLPTPVRTKSTFGLPIFLAASFNGKVSAVSAQPASNAKLRAIKIRLTPATPM